MKYLLVVVGILCCSSAWADERGERFSFFEYQIAVRLAEAAVVTPVNVKIGDVPVDTQVHHECRGVADDVVCEVTISEKTLLRSTDLHLEFIAAHEVCHIRLEHYRLDILQHIQNSDEIELEADKCAFRVLGEVKFIADMKAEVYRLLDPERTVPEDVLERAIRNIYATNTD